jgi:uncharacterized protein YjbJ (UPF0337 family)
MLVTSEFKQRSSGPMELSNMDKNRIAGAAKQAKGAVKEAAGKGDKVEGKIQNAVGGLKDALKK